MTQVGPMGLKAKDFAVSIELLGTILPPGREDLPGSKANSFESRAKRSLEGPDHDIIRAPGFSYT